MMNILTAFNNGYALPTKVMLQSLKVNNPGEITVFVLYYDLTEENITSLKELQDDCFRFVFQKIDPTVLANCPVTGHFSKESYIRLFTQDFLAETVDRVLWLDGDLIVNGSLKEYYEQNFDGKCYVAVPDMVEINNPQDLERLGMAKDDICINSGVLLMNLPLIREQVTQQSILDYIKAYSDKILSVDQDVFNGLLHDKFKILPTALSFNFVSQLLPFRKKEQAIEQKIIIHYTSPQKPWKNFYPYGAFQLWWKYYFMISDTVYDKQYKIILLTYSVRRILSFLLFLFPNVKQSPLYQKIRKKILKC